MKRALPLTHLAKFNEVLIPSLDELDSSGLGKRDCAPELVRGKSLRDACLIARDKQAWRLNGIGSHL
jgi:hypothetical protein